MRMATILVVLSAMKGPLAVWSHAATETQPPTPTSAFTIDEAGCQEANSDLERSDLGCSFDDNKSK